MGEVLSFGFNFCGKIMVGAGPVKYKGCDLNNTPSNEAMTQMGFGLEAVTKINDGASAKLVCFESVAQ